MKLIYNFHLFSGITYSGLWIQDEIPPEEFSAGIAFVGLTEIEICHGESFSIGELNTKTLVRH